MWARRDCCDLAATGTARACKTRSGRSEADFQIYCEDIPQFFAKEVSSRGQRRLGCRHRTLSPARRSRDTCAVVRRLPSPLSCGYKPTILTWAVQFSPLSTRSVLAAIDRRRAISPDLDPCSFSPTCSEGVPVVWIREHGFPTTDEACV
jgi:hypothetical protein